MKILEFKVNNIQFVVLKISDFAIVLYVDKNWHVVDINKFTLTMINNYETHPLDLSDKPDYLLRVILKEVFKNASN